MYSRTSVTQIKLHKLFFVLRIYKFTLKICLVLFLILDLSTCGCGQYFGMFQRYILSYSVRDDLVSWDLYRKAISEMCFLVCSKH
jgi:hypothetical protein